MKKSLLALLLVSSFSSLSQAHAMTVAFENDQKLPLVYLTVAFREGAATDPQGQSGASNFVAQMLLRGSKEMTKGQFDLALDQIGAQLEVDTRAEFLVLRGAVLESQLDKFLDLLKKVITEPTFPDDEAKKLKAEEVSQILADLNRDGNLASKKFTEFLFQGHPYGKPIKGKSKELDHLTKEQIIARYKQLFQSEKLLVLGSGAASESHIRDWAESVAKSLPKGEAPQPLAPPQESKERKLILIDKPQRTQTQIMVGQVGVQLTNPDFFALNLGNHAFGGGSFSSRLMSEIREKRGWSYFAYSSFRFGRQPRSWSYHMAPQSNVASNALQISLDMVNKLKQGGITQQEFDFAQQSLVNSSGFMNNTPEKRMENKLLELALGLPTGFMQTYAQKTEELTLSQVNKALAKFAHPDHLVIGALCTVKDLKDPLIKAAGVDPKQVQVVDYTTE